MDKSRFKQSLIFSTMFILTSFAVYAQEGRMAEMLDKMGRFVGEIGGTTFGFKFLLWIALFALVNFALRRNDRFDQKVAGIVSFALATGTVLLIPADAVRKIFALYSFIVVVALGLIVPLIVFGIVYRTYKEKDLADSLIRIAAYALISVALFWFNANAKGMITGDAAGVGFVDISLLFTIVYMMAVFFAIAAIINLVQSLGGIVEGGELRSSVKSTVKAPFEAAGGAKDALKDLVTGEKAAKRLKDWSMSEYNWLDKLYNDVNSATDETQLNINVEPHLNREERNLRKMQTRLNKVFNSAQDLVVDFPKLKSDVLASTGKMEIANNELIKLMSHRGEFEEKVDSLTATNFATVKSELKDMVKKAIDFNNDILIEVDKLIDLERANMK